MLNLHRALEVATTAARRGGDCLMKYRGQLKDIQTKSASGDLVTEADLASEKIVLQVLTDYFPNHGILAEESGAHQETPTKTNTPSDYLWAVDPLDGTLNYAHGLPFFCVSIGLTYKNQPVVGVVYAPYLKELYQAIAPESLALLNGNAIQVSQADTLEQSLLATGFPYRRGEMADNNYAEFMHLANQTQGIRRPGSAALDLCFVAAGRYEGYWEKHLNPWDLAAGAALVTAAGGRVSGYQGKTLDLDSGAIVASNGHIHPLLIQQLAQVRTP